MKEVCCCTNSFFFEDTNCYFDTVSSPPRNATIQRVNNQMARVQWSEPTLANGRIIGYHIYVHNVAANLTEVKKFQSSNFAQHSMEYSIHNLSMMIEYVFITHMCCNMNFYIN